MFLGFDGYAGKETTDVTSDHDAWGVDIESRRRAFHLSSVAPPTVFVLDDDPTFMTVDPDAIADTLATGDTDATNRAIDDLDDLDTATQYRLYDDLLDACRPVFEDADDGYVRQSVVRALREAYPMVELRLAGTDVDDVDGITLADTADQRERYVGFLLNALDDDDGRVRKAAADAFDLLGVGLGVADLADEQDRIVDDLQTLATSQPDEKRKHTEQARQSVERFGVGGVLADALTDTDS